MKMRYFAPFALSCFCLSHAQAQSPFNGFYEQIGIGYETIKQSTSGVSNLGSDTSSYSVSANSANSFTGVLSAGYYFKLDSNLLLGLGGDITPFRGSQASFNGSTPSTGGQYYKASSYNVFLSPAYAIGNNQLAYAKIGFSGVKIVCTGNCNSLNYLSGYLLGVGYKKIFYKNLYGFGEANYSSYAKSNYGSYTGPGGSTQFQTNSTNFLVGMGLTF